MRGRFLFLCALLTWVLTAAGVSAQGMDGARPRRVLLPESGAAACAATKIAAANHVPRNSFSVASANFDATFYHLDLNIDMVDDSLVGVVRVEGRVINAALTKLTLDLAASMHVTAVSLAGGGALAFTHSGAALKITLPAAQSVGTLVAVDIRYRGIPVENDFGNFVFGTRFNGDRYAWSLSEPYGAREWWPCKDHPSDKADSVHVTVTVPSAYRVGSQGLLVGENVNGANTTYDWLSHYPIASYLISVAVGKYVRYQDTYVRSPTLVGAYGPLALPLDHLVYNDADHDLPEGWALTADALDIEESWFGPYPFANEKYGHSEFTFGGGMEHQTMTSIGSGSIAVVSHELAHQWYGDSISPKRWAHLWLSEGFATYAEILYWEARTATFPGAYDAVLGGNYRGARRATGTLVLQDTTSVQDMFDGYRVYAKGAMVLYMLRYVTGDAVFKQIMQAYAADPAVRYGNAVTADFQRVAETVSGLNLDAFFREWVTDGTGYPTYAASSTWQATGGGNYHVTVTLAQQQTPSQSNIYMFEMPVEIAVYNMSPADTLVEIHRERVQNNLRSQSFEFDVASKPAKVSVDPDKRILRSDTITNFTIPSYPTIYSVGPNPANAVLTIHYLLDRDSRVDLHVFDVAGRRVLTQTVSNVSMGAQSVDLDTSALSSGVYFLRLSTTRGKAFQKFVVVR